MCNLKIFLIFSAILFTIQVVNGTTSESSQVSESPEQPGEPEYVKNMKKPLRRLGLDEDERKMIKGRAGSLKRIVESETAIKTLKKIYEDLKEIITDRKSVTTILRITSAIRSIPSNVNGANSLKKLFDQTTSILVNSNAHKSLKVFREKLEDLVQHDNTIRLFKAKSEIYESIVNYEHFDFTSKEIIRFIQSYPKRFKHISGAWIVKNIIPAFDNLLKANNPLIKLVNGALNNALEVYQSSSLLKEVQNLTSKKEKKPKGKKTVVVQPSKSKGPIPIKQITPKVGPSPSIKKLTPSKAPSQKEKMPPQPVLKKEVSDTKATKPKAASPKNQPKAGTGPERKK